MSDAARWQELERLYHEALQRPAGERTALVDQQPDPWLRSELASLLSHDQSADCFLDQPALDVAARTLPLEEVSLEAGSLIGAYKVLEQIGRGGMGVVYRAEQQYPVRRDVALKIIKPGMDSEQVIARFQAERQALALMNHPNIARVLDAGATLAGRLYFVMELVDGLPVNDYCRQHQLSLREKLALFIPICRAIHHAHQKGIIHRDIKPSNVLVTVYDGKPVPKMIDFGIAKAMRVQLTENSFHTRVGAMVGTLEYMSPEQADSDGADLDTRSDVYSLGVMLYELLAGSTPLNRPSLGAVSETELLRRIREDSPPAPSARLGESKLQREVRGDLDSVVMKALEKDRARRYASVSGLSDDIENYLAGAPVTAGPPSTIYRLRKMATRHRGAIATAAAFLALLVGATVFSAREALRARRSEQASAAVNEFLASDMLAQASAYIQANSSGRPDPNLKVRTALDRAAARVGARFGGQPMVEASIRHTIGATYLDLGLFLDAERQLTRAIQLRRQALGDDDPGTLTSQDRLVSVYLGQGKPALAEPLSQQVLNSRRRILGERHPDTLTSRHKRADVEQAFARDTPAEALYRQAADLRQQVLGPEHPDTLLSLTSLAFVSMRLEKFAQAEEIHRQVLAIRRRRLGEDHPETLQSKNALAQVLFNANQARPAEVLLREVLAWRRRVLGPSHPETLSTLNSLGIAHQALGQYAPAETLLSECLEVAGKAFGAEHPATFACRNTLAEVLQSEGKFDSAERHFRTILELDRRQYGPEGPDTLRSLSNLGVTLAAGGRYAEARTVLEQAVALRERVLGAKNPKTLSSLDSLASVQWKQGQLASARELFQKVVTLRREVLGPKHSRTLSSLTSLADVLVDQGRHREAEPILRETLAASGNDKWARSCRQSLLGASLAGQQRLAEAEPLLRAGYAGLLAGQGSHSSSARLEVERARRRLHALAKQTRP